MRLRSRRTATLLAVPTLVLGGLTLTGPSASADPVVPATAVSARTWLTGQLQDGLILSPYDDPDGNPYPDYGLTIDVALAAHAVDPSGPVVGEVSAAIADHLDAYLTPGGGTDLAAGGVAKALVLAQTAGADTSSYGGHDLVTDLEGRVATEGVLAGRIQDEWHEVDQYSGDFANVIGQAFAAQGLDEAGSSDTDEVTDFLLEQQCAAGYFRQYFAAADAADQTCDGGDGKPSVDTTAIVVRALQSQTDDTDVAARVDDAVAWLLTQQRGNGGFGSDADIPTANANSTGVAAYALAITGHPTAAGRAAAWLRAHQAANVGTCRPFGAADRGAVLYDDAARTAGLAGPMDDQLVYQSARATADALPGLLAAPAGPGDPNVLYAPGYAHTGSRTQVGVNDATPGAPLCAVLGAQRVLRWANPAGEAHLPLRVPTRAGTYTATVSDASGAVGTARIRALGAKKLSLSVKERVHAGGTQVVKVRGLAAGEQGSVVVRWPAGRGGAAGSGAAGQANGKGVLRVSFPVPKKVSGRATVRAHGQFRDRAGRTSFTVTR